MENILIFGHKKPDTDSVVASISLSYLKNSEGYKTTPYVLGRINNETKYLLNYFNVNTPKYLNDVKLQIKDINYYRGYCVNEYESIYETYLYMKEKNITGVPIVDNNKTIKGMVTNKNILEYIIEKKDFNILTSYKNILDISEGTEILKFDDEIKGEVISPSYRSTTFMDEISLNSDMILILGNRHSIIEYAIKSHVKMLILVGNSQIKEEHLLLAKQNKVNIISTSKNAVDITRCLTYSNYVSTIIGKDRNIFINNKDYYNDFLDIHDKYRFTNYPVIDNNKKCLGLLRTNNLSDKNRKKVILVDHNELIQSVDGLEEAEILEVVDHHKLGNFSTINPININTMPVGSTNTIIYYMYKREKVEIPKTLAGIMMGAILSDTLLFKSPTTTTMDEIVVGELEKICGVDHYELGLSMIKAGASLKGKTKEEILYSDFKGFVIDDKKVGIGQITTLDFSSIRKELSEYIEMLNDICKNEDYYILALFATDIINNGSYIIYNDDASRILEKSFDIEEINEGYFIEGCISRKKQIIPKIMEALEKGR
ncbi:MAG: putative manganese-dependent inorganic diphosphatase [Bacilli bacterium]